MNPNIFAHISVGRWPLFLFIIFLAAGSAAAQAALTDDAEVVLSSNTNRGGNPVLNISGTSNSYIKFRLTPVLPPNTPGSQVSKSTVKLYVGKVRAAGKVDVFVVNGPWDESSISANNAPPLGSLVTTMQIGLDREGDFVVFDVSALVQQWLGSDGQGTGGIPNFGIALAAHPIDSGNPGLANVDFDSKENAQTSHEAQLNVQLDTSADALKKVAHDATLTGDGTTASPLGVANGGIDTVHLADNAVSTDKLANGSVTSAKISAPLSLTSADPAFTFSAANTGTGAAITATGAINTSTQYNIGGSRVLGQNLASNNLAVGTNAGTGNGSGNLFVGQSAGQNNNGGGVNTFVGQFAGQSNTTGTFNSFFGNFTGASNTDGCCNNFFGNSAGFSNTTGGLNSFFGGSAGLFNTTGSSNLFFGDRAGQNNTTGFSNTFVGVSSGNGNVTGVSNTLLGSFANVAAGNLSFATAIGSGATVSSNNTVVLGRPADTVRAPGNLFAVGNVGIGQSNAGSRLTVAGLIETTNGGLKFPDGTIQTTAASINPGAFIINQTAIQSGANFSIAGTGKAGIFDAATQYNLEGIRFMRSPTNDDVFIGVLAGPNTPTGQRNTYVGLLAGALAVNASDNTAFGNRAGGTVLGSGNTFFGSNAGGNGAGPGHNNTFIGFNADIAITQHVGNNLTVLGANAKVDPITNGRLLEYSTAIGAGAVNNFSDMIVLGKVAGTYEGVARPADIVRTAGIFQPALSSPGGSPVCFNNGLSLCSSSLRYKTDIHPYLGGLNVLNRLRPITFAWKEDGRRDVGFGAEEVFKVEPLLTFRNDKGELEGVQYAQISTVLVNSVKEQQAQIESQAKEITALRQQIRLQKERTDLMIRMLCGKRSKAKICRK
jgi:hypothetical protein